MMNTADKVNKEQKTCSFIGKCEDFLGGEAHVPWEEQLRQM